MSQSSGPAVTQESFDRFLALLDSDRDEAGRKYESIRRRLLTFFRCRDCAEAESLADETIDRVIRKQDEVEIRDPIMYAFGVARRVASESHKRAAEGRALQPPPEADPHDERMLEFLETCMEKLPRREQSMILEYYQHEKAAKIDDKRKIAAALGIGHTALRVRAYRIRRQLEDCVTGRLKEAAHAV